MAGIITLAGCGRKNPIVIVPGDPSEESVGAEARTKTRETNQLGKAIDAYAAHPTAEASEEVKKRFLSLDGEVADLQLFVAKSKGAEREEATAKLNNLQSYRTAELLRFGALPAYPGSPVSSEARNDSRTGSEKVEQKARDLADTLEAGAKRAGDSIKEAAERTKEAVGQ